MVFLINLYCQFECAAARFVVFIPLMQMNQFNFFCKTVLKVKRTTMNEMIYGELGRVPLMVLRLFRIIKYWLKIIKSKSYRLINVLYNVKVITIITDETRVNWVSKVRDVLCTYGFGEVWFKQGVGYVNAVFNQIRSRARDMYLQNFHSHFSVIHSCNHIFIHLSFYFERKRNMHLRKNIYLETK